jgi:hypothetical protein
MYVSAPVILGGLDLWGFRISASSLVRASSDDAGKGNKIRRIEMEEQINKNFFFPFVIGLKIDCLTQIMVGCSVMQSAACVY